MGADWLLPLYDPFTGCSDSTRRDGTFCSRRISDRVHRVLDIGCGTGSLVVLVKQLFPHVEVVGLDPDKKALARATRKAQRAGANIQFHRGFSDTLDYPDASFDRVFLFVHVPSPRTRREGTNAAGNPARAESGRKSAPPGLRRANYFSDYGAARRVPRSSRSSRAACAANCAVIVSTNGRSGQVRTESRSGGFWPETARSGAICEVLIGPWSV
jgi:SAM-dependent methyltransferase